MDSIINPYDVFDRWYEIARLSIKKDPNAMVLSTSVMDRPSSRVVLMKYYDERGLVFFTNYESHKGMDLFTNRFCSLLFYWPDLGWQVRMEGKVHRTSEEESENYFDSRAFLSRVGAIVSPQSHIIDSRYELIRDGIDTIMRRKIQRPAAWGGFRVTPHMFEFWEAGPFRLHKRTEYVFDGVWTKHQLAP